MIKKVILAVLICCVMISIVPLSAQAAQVDYIQPMWDNTSVFTSNLTFDKTTGEFTVFVYGKSGVTNITLDVQLYYKNAYGSWVKTSENWQYDVNQSYFSVSDTFTGVAGREYKIEVTGTVTKGSVTEQINGSATAVCPSTT